MKESTNFTDEYREAGALHRLHITLLFGQMTVYLAATAGLFKVALENQDQANGVQILVSFIGIILSSVFWIIMERAAEFLHYSRRRAVEIEKKLQFELYQRGPSGVKKYFTAINATRGLYIAGLILWSVNLIAKILCNCV